MRWILSTTVYPKSGDSRERTFFAWVPIRIDNEVRWLETVKIRQQYLSSGWDCDEIWDNKAFLN